MSDEIEYIEPTQEHVGQMVEVRDGDWQKWISQKLYGVINHPHSRFVAGDCDNGTPLAFNHARIARPLTYAERQARCGLKVGDRVRFTRAWEMGEACRITYISTMDDYIGKVGTVETVGTNGIDVKFSKRSLWLPYFVLEKVEDRVATNLDVGETVYVDGSPQDEFEMLFAWHEGDSVWRAVVRSGDKRFVYELSNLRVKK